VTLSCRGARPFERHRRAAAAPVSAVNARSWRCGTCRSWHQAVLAGLMW